VLLSSGRPVANPAGRGGEKRHEATAKEKNIKEKGGQKLMVNWKGSLMSSATIRDSGGGHRKKTPVPETHLKSSEKKNSKSSDKRLGKGKKEQKIPENSPAHHPFTKVRGGEKRGGREGVFGGRDTSTSCTFGDRARKLQKDGGEKAEKTSEA